MAGWLLLVVGTAAAAAPLGWWFVAGGGWRPGLAIALAAVLGAVAAWSWWRQPTGQLAWDGARWTFAVDSATLGAPGVPTVALDLQRLLLVRWSAPGGGRWFWLQRRGPQAPWDALRRAVYSRPDADAPSGAEPPPSAIQ